MRSMIIRSVGPEGVRPGLSRDGRAHNLPGEQAVLLDSEPLKRLRESKIEPVEFSGDFGRLEAPWAGGVPNSIGVAK